MAKKKVWTHKDFKKAEFVGSYKPVNDSDGEERTFRLVSKEKIKKNAKGIMVKVIKTLDSWQLAKTLGWVSSTPKTKTI